MPSRKLFVTTALPYANGPFHIGHVMEYIQADIWVRFQRMQEDADGPRTVYFIGADDAHGAPIMLAAEKAGKSPESFIAEIAKGRQQYLDGFHIAFDNWHSTHSAENTELSQGIYRRLKAAGLVYVKPVEQLYDPVKRMFLADRYIKGECPNCGAKDQYGDACENCSSVYSATALKNPYSTLSGAKPLLRTSEHHFFRLSDPNCKVFLKEWINKRERLQSQVANKAKEWLDGEGDKALGDWDISRDPPYFGIRVPDIAGEKYLYVWLDAPVGYFASLKNYCARKKLDFDSIVKPGSDVEMIHFIGKDIIYFHTLFWPAMLEYSGYKTPDHVYVHGFITVSGDKMSKSRGTGIDPLRYLSLGLNPEWLRYYIAAKLNAAVEDLDFNPDDFMARVNSDLIGKYINIASRSARFIQDRFGGSLFDITKPVHYTLPTGENAVLDPNLLRPYFVAKAPGESENNFVGFEATPGAIAHAYENREFSKALKGVMTLADLANSFVNQFKPWELARDRNKDELLHATCTNFLEIFRLLTIYLKPVLPDLSRKVEEFLNLEHPLEWRDIENPLKGGHRIRPYTHLMTRVEDKQLDQLFDIESVPQVSAPQRHPEKRQHASKEQAVSDTISIEDFNKLDFRVAKIVKAEHVEGADKLLRLTLEMGADAAGVPLTRTVLAGIKAAYEPAKLEGRLAVVVANLAPRTMKFGVSEGMVLAASGEKAGDGPGIFLISPDTGAQPGMRVK